MRIAKKIIVSTCDDFNALLEDASKRLFMNYGRKDAEVMLGFDAYVWEDLTKIHLLGKFNGKAKEYIFKTIDTNEDEFTSGGDAFRILSQYAKIQRVKNPKSYGSLGALLYRNEKFEGKRIIAYEYDINSAFAYQMLKPIPNIESVQECVPLKKGQIGFQRIFNEDKMKNDLLVGFTEGKNYTYVFDLMPSPFKNFVSNYYKKKKMATSYEEKQKNKQILNFAIGSIQNYNPFLRACIIGRSNMFIEQFIDENTIYANTDSIVSATPRPDIEKLLGKEIGQFKKEHYGVEFAMQVGTFNYQWQDEIPVWRGAPKQRFIDFETEHGRKFDILIDTISEEQSYYKFNHKEWRLEYYGKK